MTSTALAVHTRRLDVPTTTSGHHVPVAGAPQQRGARGSVLVPAARASTLSTA
jgi:hypothetical protein